MEVFVDILLLQNFIVNLFLLYITLQTLRIKVKLRYLIISSTLGALYVLTLIFPKLNIFTLLPFKLLIAIIMMLVVLKGKGIWMVIKSSIIYILYSMLLCGFIVFIELDKKKSWTDMLSYGSFSYKSTLMSLMLLYVIMHRMISYIKDRKSIDSFTYMIEIGMKDFNASIRAFLDTGNELKEPITNLPVILVEKGMLQGISLNQKNTLYIPYKVINGGSGRIEGFKPSYIKLYKDKEKYEYINAIIGLCDGQLSEVNDYNALLSRGIF